MRGQSLSYGGSVEVELALEDLINVRYQFTTSTSWNVRLPGKGPAEVPTEGGSYGLT